MSVDYNESNNTIWIHRDYIYNYHRKKTSGTLLRTAKAGMRDGELNAFYLARLDNVSANTSIDYNLTIIYGYI